MSGERNIKLMERRKNKMCMSFPGFRTCSLPLFHIMIILLHIIEIENFPV